MTAPLHSLTSDRFSRVRELFQDAIDVPTPGRDAWLAERCANDDALRGEVQSLLDAFQSASAGWERPAASHLAEVMSGDLDASLLAADTLAPGERLGAYIVTRKIGEGGMGAVFEGRRADDAYQSRVALKTLGRGLVSSNLARRFLRERQILARLQHPNIAALFDGGANARGIPYLVMEFVDGVPIDQYCTRHALTIAQRLDLFQQVCTAVQYAHRNLVIHRDLKPSNILVREDGVVKLLDFGIATLASNEVEAEEGVTRDGVIPLTSAYASPEQARGDAITTASDIYTAGVVLYRLLCGVSPYAVDRRTPAELLEILSTRVPPPPSSVASDDQARACGQSDAMALRRTLVGELDAIVSMALRKEPDRRYPSAEALSEDIRRYLKGLPVVARPDTLGYRVSRFVRRQRAVVAGGAVAVLSLVTGTIVAIGQARAAREEATRASHVTQYLQAVVGAADPAHYSSVRTGKKDVGLIEVLDSTRSRVALDLGDEPRTRADLYWSMGNTYRAFGRHDVALLLQDSARLLHAATVGAQSVEVARDVHFIGVTLQDLGRFEEAVARFREAYALYALLPAAPDTEVTDVMTSLGQALGVAVQRFDEGESLLRRAEGRELGERQARPALLGLVQGALGTTLMQRGSYVAAESAYARSVASYSRDSVRARSERGIILANWATLLSREAKYGQAVAVRERALRDVLLSLGEESIVTVRIRQRLADDLMQLERFDGARAQADSGLAMLERLTTVHAIEWTNMLRVLGGIATRQGDLRLAERQLDRANVYLRQLTGGGRVGPEVALLSEYARLREAQGNHASARASYASAYETALAAVGATNPVTALALDRYVAFLRRTGDVARAESLRRASGSR